MKKVLLPICLALLTWTGSGSVLEAQAQSGPHKVVVAKKRRPTKRTPTKCDSSISTSSKPIFWEARM